MDMYSQWGNLHLMKVPERSKGFDPLEMLTGVNNWDERSESRLWSDFVSRLVTGIIKNAKCSTDKLQSLQNAAARLSLGPENSTASHLWCGSFTGYQYGKGSGLRQPFWSSSAFVDWLRHICLSRSLLQFDDRPFTPAISQRVPAVRTVQCSVLTMRLLEPFARYKAAKYLMTMEWSSPGNVTDGRFAMGHPSNTKWHWPRPINTPLQLDPSSRFCTWIRWSRESASLRVV